MPNNDLLSALEKKKEEYEQAKKLHTIMEKRKKERQDSIDNVCGIIGMLMMIIGVLIMLYANGHAILVWGEYDDYSLINAYTLSLPYILTGWIVCATAIVFYTITMGSISTTIIMAVLGPIPIFLVVLIITWILILALLFIEEIIALFIKSHPISKFLRTVFL